MYCIKLKLVIRKETRHMWLVIRGQLLKLLLIGQFLKPLMILIKVDKWALDSDRERTLFIENRCSIIDIILSTVMQNRNVIGLLFFMYA